MKKRNEELVTATFTLDGFKGGFNNIPLNVEIRNDGLIRKRGGYNTFGEMVDVLWKLNKQNKRLGFIGDYTVRLPLKGTKPIYKKTLSLTK